MILRAGGLAFTVHHGPRLKAFIAVAFETPDHVGARSVPAGVADGALVGVYKTRVSCAEAQTRFKGMVTPPASIQHPASSLWPWSAFT